MPLASFSFSSLSSKSLGRVRGSAEVVLETMMLVILCKVQNILAFKTLDPWYVLPTRKISIWHL